MLTGQALGFKAVLKIVVFVYEFRLKITIAHSLKLFFCKIFSTTQLYCRIISES